MVYGCIIITVYVIIHFVYSQSSAPMVTPRQLTAVRKDKGWTQQQAAARLGVSQSYLALLESGLRQSTLVLARRCVKVYGLTAEFLPVSTDPVRPKRSGNEELAGELAALGYPGFAHLRHRGQRNPAELLFAALFTPDLDSRVAEALPWVVSRYPNLDWDWLLTAVKVHELQNRLGFVVSLARQVCQERGDHEKAAALSGHEAALDRAKLAREDTLADESLTESEKRWLRVHRPARARAWNLLTDLDPHNLRYAP
jgi:transcriptional regulator with XRE-family HTH domain